jgi:hypothetical protein
MPSRRARHALGEICPDCRVVHLDRFGNNACVGHVTYDRDSYVKGQDRKKLDQPRACLNPPKPGLSVCDKHGAKAEQAKAAGKQRDAERKASQIMRRFGGPIDTTPSEALLDTVKWTAGYVAWLRDKVAAVTSDEKLIWGQTRRTTGERASVTHEATTNAWLALLGEWSDRLVRVCAEAIRAGIEERRVRLAEAQGALVADVIRKILGDLDLTPAQAAKAGEVVPMRLRSLAS